MEVERYISRARLAVLSAIGAFLLGAVLFKYGAVMLSGRPPVAERKIQTERGSILDRNGKILAVQTTLYNIAVTRSAVSDEDVFSQALAPVTGMNAEEIKRRLSDNPGDFLYLKKKISEGEKSAIEAVIRDGRLKGIRLEAVVSRTYPENQLASHVIGFLGDDGKGLTGVEYSYQDILSPPGDFPSAQSEAYNVMLTIDGNIQYELEKIARQTMEETQAEGVMLIAAEARTGEILAYVSEPSANLNAFGASLPTERFDRPALYAYEPGSVFKIFSIAALMELGAAADQDIFFCDGGYEHVTPKGERFTIGCLDRHGWVSPRDIIRFSCNDGTAQIAEKAKSADFEDKLRGFGFGSKTNIQLPGETTGIFSSNNNWSLRSKPTIAIGQEISVSALQMVQAATALANKGTVLRLSLLSRLYTQDGEAAASHRTESLGRVISPETARLMLDYMQTTSESGTGTRASVGDVPMAVKTGTAQMLAESKAGYSKTDYISSCMGIFPVDSPEIILYLAILKPVGETYGGRIAAPVISKAANAIIDYRGMGRETATSVRHSGLVQIPKNAPVEIRDIVPDMTGIPKRMIAPLLQREDLEVWITGDGYVVSQSPEPGTLVTEGMRIELHLE